MPKLRHSTVYMNKRNQFYRLVQAKKGPEEICRDLGIHRATYYRWLHGMKEHFELNDREWTIETKTKVPDIFKLNEKELPDELSDGHEFRKIQLIQEYITMQEINQSPHYVNHIFRICNAAECTPEQLSESLEAAKTHFMKFLQMFPSEQTAENYRKAMRKFLQFRGITIPPRDRIFSGGTDSKGDYAKVYLSLTELDQVAKIVGEDAGSEYEDLFRVHHEVFARPTTMLKWIPNFEATHVDIDGKSYTFGQASILEPKQKKTYDKIIIDPKALKILSDYSGKRIVTDSEDLYERKYAKALKRGYVAIGKIHDVQTYKKGQEGWLFYNRPIYCIRHSSAVTWMHRTSFDASMVANMGWEKVDTLTNFYAKSTSANMMQKGVCYYCNPPSIKSSLPLFCSPLHSLVWYNNGRMAK